MFFLASATSWAVLLCAFIVHADERARRYGAGERIPIWGGRVGPHFNSHEIHDVLDWPTCEFQSNLHPITKNSARPGDWLRGNLLTQMPNVNSFFRQNVNSTVICQMNPLDVNESLHINRLTEESYSINFYIDDLPLLHFLGPSPGKVYLDKEFILYYNNDRVVGGNILPTNVVSVVNGEPLTFSYSVTWYESTLPFERRLSKYFEVSLVNHWAHWFSVVNGIVISMVLCAVVMVILAKTIRNDFARYAAADPREVESLENTDDSGWKQIHGDVFRRPPHLLVLSVFLGTGSHLGLTAVVVIGFALLNSYYTQRGLPFGVILSLYVATQSINGFAGGYFFRLHGGKSWRRAMMSQLLFFPALAAAVYVNLLAISLAYHADPPIDFIDVLKIAGLFVFVCFPLHGIGTRLGRMKGAQTPFPCRIHQLKRPIPPKSPFFLPSIILGAGFIPFGTIFVELYFAFEPLWDYRVYYVFGLLYVTLGLACLVIVCSSITAVYLTLNAEDSRWMWVSFASSGSVCLYAALFCIYYYYTSKMSGLVQTLYFFQLSALCCISVGLVCGNLAYFGASAFVWVLYRNIKSE